MSLPPTNAVRIPSAIRLIECFLLSAAALLFVLHFLHLSADFPNHSGWNDWAKYTDEGWYGDAAIRHYQLGHWYLPGDFNPAAALPVWPFLEAILFHFTGVSAIAARALTVVVFGGILAAAYTLLLRWQPHWPGPARPRLKTLAPGLAVLLLAANPFCLVFTRLAILEPLMILLTLLALHAATSAGLAASGATGARAFLPILALGLLMPAMVLTKTTALFLLPSVACLLWAATGYKARLLLRTGLPAVAIAALAWTAFFLLLVRPHYLQDYRYLFSANGYTGITSATAFSVIHDALTKGINCIGAPLCGAWLIAVIISLVRVNRLRRQPLIACLFLWITGYLAFLAYHDNLQVRYYLVILVPMVLSTTIVFEPALRWLVPMPDTRFNTPRFLAGLTAAGVFALLLLPDARQTLHFLRHPDYTLRDASLALAQVVRSDPHQKALVLSISGSEMSLFNGLPSICDDFGTLELADRINLYRPGWYAAWNQVDDDKMDALNTLYSPTRVAAFPVMDDPDRNLLILYRLDQKGTGTRRHTPPKPIPKSLRTRIGQQPSVNQLEH